MAKKSSQTREQINTLHTTFTQKVFDSLKANGENVELADAHYYDFKWNDEKVVVNAHRKSRGRVVVEYASDKHDILSRGCDKMVFIDPDDSNHFFITSPKDLKTAMDRGLMIDYKNYQVMRGVGEGDVLKNAGICVGISQSSFEKINGVTKFSI